MNPIAQILKRRNVGRVVCATFANQKASDARAHADRAASAQGLRTLGDGWLEISGYDAHTIATSVLHRDLAFGNEIMPRSAAVEFIEALLDLAPEPHMYFTNGDWADALGDGEGDDAGIADPAGGVSFDPLSDAAFDAGIVCVGDGVTAILWVEDNE